MWSAYDFLLSVMLKIISDLEIFEIFLPAKTVITLYSVQLHVQDTT